MKEACERLGEKLENEIMKMKAGDEKTIDGIRIRIEKIQQEAIVWS